jgi:hypothetical protein
MTRAEFQKALITLAGTDKEFAAIPPFEMLNPKQAAAVLNISVPSLAHRRRGTDVLTRIDVSCHGARRRTYEYNKREVIGLLRIRQQPKASPREVANRLYERVG